MSEPPGGETAVVMLQALLAGQDYPPPGVTDTPANRDLWDRIAADVEAMPGGVIPEIPADWSLWPDDNGTGDTSSS